jgi:malate dehydrogenase (oxaloacetate-decarboxylating)(NADP+)
MKMAASQALAALAKEPAPDYVAKAHKRDDMVYGPNYIIPSPFDKRLLVWVSSAVAEAAVKDGVAGVKDFDLQAYKAKLQALSDHFAK